VVLSASLVTEAYAQTGEDHFMSLEVITVASRPDLEAAMDEAFRGEWPEFLFHDPVSQELADQAISFYPDFNLLVLADGLIVAGGWGVLVAWDGTPAMLPEGYDGSLMQTVEAAQSASSVNTLVIMAAAVRSGYQGQGLSRQVLSELKDRALSQGLEHVIAPVRPTLKSRYPLTPMLRYASWRRSDGTSVDPWIRIHEAMGAWTLGPALASMRIIGTVLEWEAWAGMVFPESGDYVVPGALDLVAIDVEQDKGEYLETNLWMEHPL
jgi:GNAT superfamily N-acetyltransferase